MAPRSKPRLTADDVRFDKIVNRTTGYARGQVAYNTKADIQARRGAFTETSRPVERAQRAFTVYNLERNLSKEQLRSRVETMIGRQLTNYEYRKLKARRVTGGDETRRTSERDAFGNRNYSTRTLEAWRITYS